MTNLIATSILLAGLVTQGDDVPRKPATPQREPGPSSDARSDALRMTRAVACRSIDGYEKYEPLLGGSLTADEKLLIYYRPLNYTTRREGDEYRVHLMQDGRIRRAGDKRVLRSKKDILDYEPKSREPLDWIFLKNAVPLKGLPPGDYEYDILLRDEKAPGPPVVQSVKFKIVAAELPADSKEQKSRARRSPAKPKASKGRQGETALPFDADVDVDSIPDD